PALYGASANGELFSIDTNTGAGTLIGILPFGYFGGSTEIVFNNTTRRAWTQFSPSAAVGGEEFDITTGAGIGGPIATAGAFNGLEWVGSTLYGTMITSGGGASQLRTLDPFAGPACLVGATGRGPIAGLAYDQTTGTKYGITGGNGSGGGAIGNLVTINLTTGAATTVGSVGFNAGSLEFGPDGNLYAGSVGGTGNLFRINKSTGASTLIGATGFVNVTGLALVTATSPTPTPTPTPTASPTPTPTPTPTPQNDQIVISQIYGGGGTAGATYRNDFLEIFNRGSNPVNLNN